VQNTAAHLIQGRYAVRPHHARAMPIALASCLVMSAVQNHTLGGQETAVGISWGMHHSM